MRLKKNTGQRCSVFFFILRLSGGSILRGRAPARAAAQPCRTAQNTVQTRAPLYGPLRILLPTDLSTKISLHIAFDIGDIRLGRLPDIEAASS